MSIKYSKILTKTHYEVSIESKINIVSFNRISLWKEVIFVGKVTCPKCRKILYRYKLINGTITISMSCPDCKSIVVADIQKSEKDSKSVKKFTNKD